MLTNPHCDVCNYMHPIDPSNPCIKRDSINPDEVGSFLRQLSNITNSQIDKKKIKDQKKFFNQVIVSIMKMMETYTE